MGNECIIINSHLFKLRLVDHRRIPLSAPRGAHHIVNPIGVLTAPESFGFEKNIILSFSLSVFKMLKLASSIGRRGDADL